MCSLTCAHVGKCLYFVKLVWSNIVDLLRGCSKMTSPGEEGSGPKTMNSIV